MSLASSAARSARARHPAWGPVLVMRGPTQELVDYIAAYEAEDGVTARDILVLRRNLAPGLSSVIVAPVLSLRTVICVRCVSAALHGPVTPLPGFVEAGGSLAGNVISNSIDRIQSCSSFDLRRRFASLIKLPMV